MRKQTPIIFSPEMIKAMQENRKSQTRRTKGLEKVNQAPDEWKLHKIEHLPTLEMRDEIRDKLGSDTGFLFQNNISGDWMLIKSPFGGAGDLLWIKETYAILDADKPVNPLNYRADGDIEDVKWKPSIFMPKKYCRSWKEIVSIRPERIQEITEEDAKKEGIELYNNYDGTTGGNGSPETYRSGFRFLWDSLNSKRGHGWDRNDWVWVTEFKPIIKTESK